MSASNPDAPPRSRQPHWLRVDLLGLWAYFAGRARAGLRRVRGAAFPIVEGAAAAAVAWTVSANLLERPTPILAPLAAWGCMGFKPDRRPRQVAEIGAGAFLGVLLGDLAATFWTIGPLQIFVAIIVAGLVARFLDNGDLFTVQATINVVVVLGLASAGMAGGVRDRWIDAIVGSGVAFVFAVLMPRRPTTRAVRYVRSATAELGILIGMIATALRTGEPERLRELAGQREALAKLVDESAETVRTARSVIKLNPTLRRFAPQLEELSRSQRLVKRALRTTDVIIRQATAMSEDGIAGLSAFARPLGQMADATSAMVGSVGAREAPLAAQAALREVVQHIDPDDLVDERDDAVGWRPVAFTGVLQSLSIDLLQLSGMTRAEARAALHVDPDEQG